MITLLGTNHVSPRSIHLVTNAVEDYDITAIELDKYRLEKLFSTPQKPSFFQLAKVVGVSGAVFAIIGNYVEHKIGAQVSTMPGDEMRAAIKEAAIAKKKIALIDQPIHITLQRFSKAFTLKVKWKLLKMLFKKTPIRMSPHSVPDQETIQQIVDLLDTHIPELSAVLIHERNTYMADALEKLQEKNPEETILAVIGAGHLPGISEALKNKNIKIAIHEQ